MSLSLSHTHTHTRVSFLCFCIFFCSFFFINSYGTYRATHPLIYILPGRSCCAFLGVGMSMAAMIWWIIAWNEYGYARSVTSSAYVTSAVVLSGVAMGFALSGLCLGAMFDECSCAGKITSATLFFVAFICQCFTMIVIAARPNFCSDNININCEIGGPTIMSICAIALYLFSCIGACAFPSPKSQRETQGQ